MRTTSSLFNQGLTAKVKSVKHFLTLRRQEKGLFLIMLRFASVAFPLSYNTSIYSSAIMFIAGMLIFNFLQVLECLQKWLNLVSLWLPSTPSPSVPTDFTPSKCRAAGQILSCESASLQLNQGLMLL